MKRLLVAGVLVVGCGSNAKPPTAVPVSHASAAPDAPVAPVATRPARPAGDPYKVAHWTPLLDDPRESARAVSELEQLGDPSAIEPLGAAWRAQGRPLLMLQVIIGLARPLTADEARAKFFVTYEQSGRPQSWKLAAPFLKDAVSDFDETDPRTVDGATKAADALGEAHLGLPELASITRRPVTKKSLVAQISAIRALGKFGGEPAAVAALVPLLDRPVPDHPPRGSEETFSLYLGVTGAAVNALGELRASTAVTALILQMYRTPELFTQLRRALVAAGPVARDELRKVLQGKHAKVAALFRDAKLDRYCSATMPCKPVSARDFYAAVVLGDFHDPATVPDLLEALKRPAAPSYYFDDQLSAITQYNAIFDALRKIGSADAAGPLRTLWSSSKIALETRVLAVSAYPYLARDDQAVKELTEIASDNRADDDLRVETATAFARLARDDKPILILQLLAKRYLDESAKRRAAADGKPKANAAAADLELAKAKQATENARASATAITSDPAASADKIRAATAAAKAADAAFRVAKATHKEKTQEFRRLEGVAKGYLGFARMFQTHIARIAIAIRCKDPACFGASLQLTPDEAAHQVAAYIPGVEQWTAEEKLGLVEANVDRAMLELGKAGAKASALTETLLDAAASESRVIRQSILLALPKIAPLPCASCEAKLDAAIRAGEGKVTLGDLNLETAMLRNYFSWAGKPGVK